MSHSPTSLVRAISPRYRAALWLGLLAISTAIFLRLNDAELRRAAPIVTGASPCWVATLMASQFVILALIAGKYRVLLARLGSQVSPLALARVHLRRHLVSTLVPFGGTAGLMSAVRDLSTYQVDAGTVVYSSVLFTLVNEIAFTLFLLPVIGWFALAGQTTGLLVAGGAALRAIGVVSLGGGIVVMQRRSLPGFIVNRIPTRITQGIAEARTHNVGAADIAAAVPYALAVNVAGVAMLAAALEAIGQHPSVATILAARLIGSVVAMLLPVFHGAGAVEVTVVGALHAGGVPVAEAMAATVLFRLAQVWLPLGLGALAQLPWPFDRAVLSDKATTTDRRRSSLPGRA